MLLRILIIIGFIFLFFSCSKKESLYKPTEKVNPYEIYKEGYEAFQRNDYFFASKKFSEAEINFDKAEHASKSAIMKIFSLYGINFYDEAEKNIKRFIEVYPAEKKKVMYSEYLLAIIYFEQITDEEKDIGPLEKANDQIDYFVSKYPKTEYAIDLKFKKNLIINQLAAKELYVAKFYIKTQKWIPAINRLKTIIKEYEETIFVEEALHRLVEIHYHLGLSEESEKYASILGYNYNSSEWYKQSYKILNKDYKIVKLKKEDGEENLFKKIISMIK
tara:strand:- start:312 stop:1136 length:825 start_codon:yes stop_codon:yes gene_type:complete